MSVAVVLRVFIEMVLRPRGLLQNESTCFLHACLILDVCSLGDKALPYLPLLRRTIERHHSLFTDLYGVDGTIPKYHYTMHLPDVMEAHGVNMSSFVVERKHRCAKRIANRTFSNFEHTLVHRGMGILAVKHTSSFSEGAAVAHLVKKWSRRAVFGQGLGCVRFRPEALAVLFPQSTHARLATCWPIRHTGWSRTRQCSSVRTWRNQRLQTGLVRSWGFLWKTALCSMPSPLSLLSLSAVL